jgi:hypothetical protein
MRRTTAEKGTGKASIVASGVCCKRATGTSIEHSAMPSPIVVHDAKSARLGRSRKASGTAKPTKASEERL